MQMWAIFKVIVFPGDCVLIVFVFCLLDTVIHPSECKMNICLNINMSKKTHSFSMK